MHTFLRAWRRVRQSTLRTLPLVDQIRLAWAQAKLDRRLPGKENHEKIQAVDL